MRKETYLARMAARGRAQPESFFFTDKTKFWLNFVVVAIPILLRGKVKARHNQCDMQ